MITILKEVPFVPDTFISTKNRDRRRRTGFTTKARRHEDLINDLLVAYRYTIGTTGEFQRNFAER